MMGEDHYVIRIWLILVRLEIPTKDRFCPENLEPLPSHKSSSQPLWNTVCDKSEIRRLRNCGCSEYFFAVTNLGEVTGRDNAVSEIELFDIHENRDHAFGIGNAGWMEEPL